MTVFTPTPEQKRAAAPGHSVWVAANAGSGKTQVLVYRLIRLLLAGANPAAILCLTYTKAAAAEMASRLHERLGLWAALSDEELALHLAALGEDVSDPSLFARARQLFTRALETPGGLKIQTIHAFGERLLQLFPVEAGLSPGFRVMDEREAEELRSTAQTTVLQEARTTPDTALARAYATVMDRVTAKSFSRLMADALKGNGGLARELRRADGLAAIALVLRNALGLGAAESSGHLAATITTLARTPWQEAADRLEAHSQSTLQKAGQKIRTLLLASDDDERLAALRALFFTTKLRPLAKSIATKDLVATDPALAQWLTDQQATLTAQMIRHDELLMVEATEALYALAQGLLARIDQLKQAHARYDFDDLIARTRALLTEQHLADWVLYKLDAGLEHILVDEAQDTSHPQWQIVAALISEFFSGAGRPQTRLRTVFVVGDHKQSIYSFQGADVAAFDRARADFAAVVGRGGTEMAVIDLTISYRTVPALLTVVDHTFAAGSAAVAGLERHDLPNIQHQSERLGVPGVFELWPLVEPLDDAEPTPWTVPVDREPPQSPRRRLARRIAAMIADWLRRGRIIAAEQRAVRPGDILILLQKRGVLFSALVAELRRAGVPVAGADRLRLMDNIAVQDLLALMQWLLLPDDDHSLACVLKSPLVPQALSDEDLVALAAERGALSLWQRLLAADDDKARANAAVLATWHDTGPAARPYDFLAGVLTARRRAILARLGSEALDATDALLDQALAYEEEHGASLAGFLNWFTATATEIRREMDKGSGEVRLMTVHGAKGLEANIVILPDAATLPGERGGNGLVAIPDGEPGAGLPLWVLSHLILSPAIDRWKEAARHLALRERNRLLYVAMTRARDELYVGGAVADKGLADDCWYQRLSEVFLTGPGQSLLREVPAFDGEGVVWRHGPDPVYGPPAAAPPALPAHRPVPDWATAPAPAEGRPARATVTGLARGGPPADLAAVQRALKRGSAIHLLLQELPDLPVAARLPYARRKAARLGLTEADVTGLLALMDRPDLAPFFTGGTAQSEVSFRADQPDGGTLLGQIDRLVVTPEAILILDYKTDARPPEGLGSDHPYLRQMALYARSLSLIWPGRPVSACLLWTATGRAQWLDPASLATALSEMSQAG